MTDRSRPKGAAPETPAKRSGDSVADRFSWERAFRSDPSVPADLRLLLYTVGSLLDLDGTGFFSVPQVATGMNVGQRTAARRLRQARDLGWLAQTARGHRRGDGVVLASEYELRVPLSATQGADREPPVAEPLSAKSESLSAKSASLSATWVAAPSPSSPVPNNPVPTSGLGADAPRPEDARASESVGAARGEPQEPKNEERTDERDSASRAGLSGSKPANLDDVLANDAHGLHLPPSWDDVPAVSSSASARPDPSSEPGFTPDEDEPVPPWLEHVQRCPGHRDQPTWFYDCRSCNNALFVDIVARLADQEGTAVDNVTATPTEEEPMPDDTAPKPNLRVVKDEPPPADDFDIPTCDCGCGHLLGSPEQVDVHNRRQWQRVNWGNDAAGKSGGRSW